MRDQNKRVFRAKIAGRELLSGWCCRRSSNPSASNGPTSRPRPSPSRRANDFRRPEANQRVPGDVCNTIILDPACGTANFLYVAMEHMKRLEGEVWDMLRGLGETQPVFEGTGHSVDPHQFLGIEINPRAAAIAELVLWIGYLQWHFRTFGTKMPAEPIIKPFHNIECRDAVLEYDRKEPVLDADASPSPAGTARPSRNIQLRARMYLTRPRPTLVYRYPIRGAAWPKADFIMGNPPYIGNKRMRSALGDGYVEALRKAHAQDTGTVNFVMYWWHMAAESDENSASFPLRRHTTTNSITQSFNREVIQKGHGEWPLALRWRSLTTLG